jgi:hypothetical protein
MRYTLHPRRFFASRLRTARLHTLSAAIVSPIDANPQGMQLSAPAPQSIATSTLSFIGV